MLICPVVPFAVHDCSTQNIPTVLQGALRAWQLQSLEAVQRAVFMLVTRTASRARLGCNCDQQETREREQNAPFVSRAAVAGEEATELALVPIY